MQLMLLGNTDINGAFLDRGAHGGVASRSAGPASRPVPKTRPKKLSQNRCVKWRQYGKKPLRNKAVLGKGMVRMYFRCNMPGCPAKKQIDKYADQNDEDGVISFLNDYHIHDGNPVSAETKQGSSIAESQPPELSSLNSFLTAFTILAMTGNILFPSPGFCRMTGYTSNDCIGNTTRFLEGKDTNLEASGQMEKALRQQKANHAIILHYRKDGSSFWNHMKMTPIHSNGILTSLMVIHMDLTEYDPKSLLTSFS